MNSHGVLKKISNLYFGWRMIGLVSALRVLGGGLHQYGFTVFFLPVTQDLGLTRLGPGLTILQYNRMLSLGLSLMLPVSAAGGR